MEAIATVALSGENKRLHAEQNAGIFGSPAILPGTDTDIPSHIHLHIGFCLHTFCGGAVNDRCFAALGYVIKELVFSIICEKQCLSTTAVKQ